MPEPRSFDEYFIAVLEALEESKAAYALIGGLAFNAYAQSRGTKDVDVMLGGTAIQLPAVLEALARRGIANDVTTHIKELSQDQVTFMKSAGGRLDILRPRLPFHRRVVEQAIHFSFEGHPVRLARPEHIIVLKAIAGRPRDRQDIEEILEFQQERIDRPLILREVDEVLPAGNPNRVWLEDALSKSPGSSG